MADISVLDNTHWSARQDGGFSGSWSGSSWQTSWGGDYKARFELVRVGAWDYGDITDVIVTLRDVGGMGWWNPTPSTLNSQDAIYPLADDWMFFGNNPERSVSRVGNVYTIGFKVVDDTESQPIISIPSGLIKRLRVECVNGSPSGTMAIENIVLRQAPPQEFFTRFGGCRETTG